MRPAPTYRTTVTEFDEFDRAVQVGHADTGRRPRRQHD